MLDNLKGKRIVLASASPRRKELLAGLELNFEVSLIDGIDESYPEGLGMEQIPEYISKKKAQAYVDGMADDVIVITADTIVWKDGEVLGKPCSAADAAAMLRKLSGATHQVISGVTVMSKEKSVTFSCLTDVEFDVLSDEEISHYVESYKPMDKAGAYGIQEYIGYIGVRWIRGSYFNVMGLPVQKLYAVLKAF